MHKRHSRLTPELPMRSVRDPRIDVLRGLALVMIFINHVPGNALEHFTNRNWGFSDAAEAFVFLSGTAAGLAYESGFLSAPYWPGIARVWARARTLYFVHLSTTAMAIGIFAAAALWFGLYELLTTINLRPAFANPLAVLIGIPLLGHQLGYFNILPLYLTLLLVTPLLLWVGLRRPYLLLAASVIVWVLAGQFRINLPNYPNPGGWFFNPFSWQIIFVLGLLTGIFLKRGERFVPRIGWLMWLCGAWLVATIIWKHVPGAGPVANRFMAELGSAGVPFYIVSFDKTFAAVLRLSHFLALAYILSCFSWVYVASESRWAEPFRLLGQNGLAVFATGSVLSVLLQAINAGIERSFLTDLVLIGAGLGVQFALAYALRVTKRAQANKKAIAAKAAP
ncbi:OpgC domain-containing protein [Pelagibacterium sp. H642]|uniref:OpgC family protein n=1 Tax=Pelagibacterium sp. H642 TaxID=1881069 RepID=UPI0028161561|nr:OpgC domain-containing protein [Pelagibacterium sp. H642]WMT92358.1 OpgC domain-containing protein [Pelagibacterium sp. H642]